MHINIYIYMYIYMYIYIYIYCAHIFRRAAEDGRALRKGHVATLGGVDTPSVLRVKTQIKTPFSPWCFTTKPKK